jgi:hypothetical protein
MALSILDRLNADGEIGAPSVFQNVIAAGPLAPANSHPARDSAFRGSAFSASSNLALDFDRETEKRRRISF